MSHKYDYDAVIIGAGISGLVCGCYLAKAGMKTLIVEKNARPGGYCTSFSKKGFVFDSCAHSIGGLGQDGAVKKILKELDIYDRINFRIFDPLDTVIAPDYKISFWSDIEKTIKELTDNFPRERKNIRDLIYFINNVKGAEHIQLRRKTLKDLLDRFIYSYELKAIFSFLAFGNLGLPPSLLSAFTAVKFYKQFIFDGGYYPGDKIQALPDALAERFREYSGNLILSKKVNKIMIENEKAVGVVLNNKISITAKNVISGCDASQTFFNLVGKNNITNEESKLLSELIPSVSFFILYLGIDKNLTTISDAGTNLWYLSSYDLHEIYKTNNNGSIQNIQWFMFRRMPNKRSILCFTNTPFFDKEFWRLNKDKMGDRFIKKLDTLFPAFSKSILFKDAASPQTLYKWTLNYRGAAYGWAYTPSQFAIPGLTKKTSIQNLFLTGHWTTLAPGIPGVAYLGRDTAQTIIKRTNNLS